MGALTTYVIEERGTAGVAGGLLLVLHGHDATERDLTPVAALLDPAGSYLVAGVRAPHATEGGSGAAWFASGPRGPDADQFATSLRGLAATVEALTGARDLDPARTVVVGFSQGAAMALSLALSPDRPSLAGVIAWSGYLPDVDGHEPAWAAAVGLPVLLQHGTTDDVVPVDLASDTAAVLAHHGADVTFEEHDAGHHLTIEMLEGARRWLDDLPSPTQPPTA